MERLILFQSLANNAIYGITIGISVAFPILVIATRNLITGFLATLSMASSTVCVIGMITLGGWKLGVSLAFPILVIACLSIASSTVIVIGVITQGG